jgi:hypothetical protein
MYMWLKQMCFNTTKCYELKVTRKTSPIVYNYNIKEAALKPVEEHPYLGVHLSKDLKWNVHVAEFAKEANSTLGFIRRNLGKCSQGQGKSIQSTGETQHGICNSVQLGTIIPKRTSKS